MKAGRKLLSLRPASVCWDVEAVPGKACGPLRDALLAWPRCARGGRKRLGTAIRYLVHKNPRCAKPPRLSEAARRTDRWGYNLAVCRIIPATWAFLRDGSGRGGVVPSTVSHVEDFCAKNANPVCRPSPSGGRCIGVGVLRPCIEVPWKRAFCEYVLTIWRGATADAVLCLGACSMASAFRHSRSHDTGGAVLLRRLTGGGDHEAHAISGASLCFGLTRATSRRRFRRRTS